MKITVKTTVDTAKLAAIDEAAKRALALTAEVIHGQVVQAQVSVPSEPNTRWSTLSPQLMSESPPPFILYNGEIVITRRGSA